MCILQWFGADHRKLTRFCLGHLFTYQQFPGKLGLAYVGSWRFTDPGGICSYGNYFKNNPSTVSHCHRYLMFKKGYFLGLKFSHLKQKFNVWLQLKLVFCFYL